MVTPATNPNHLMTECVVLACRANGIFIRWRFMHKEGRIEVTHNDLRGVHCTKKNIAQIQQVLANANTSEMSANASLLP